MQTLKNLPGMGLSLETARGGFCTDTIEHPNPGLNIMEIWKDIKGWEGFYQVSNFGNIKSLDRIVLVKRSNRKESINVKYKGKNFTPKPKKRGYYTISLTAESVSYYYSLHRLVAKAFIPNPENKPCINHIDCDKTNNHIDNLEWVTYSENSKHAFKNGLKNQYGENNSNSKLDAKTVEMIRKLYHKNGVSQKQISEIFNMSHGWVSKIVNYKIWTIPANYSHFTLRKSQAD